MKRWFIYYVVERRCERGLHVEKAIVLILMAFLSLTNLFGVTVAGVSVLVGVTAFFIFKKKENKTYQESGFDIKSAWQTASRPKIWLWIFAPLGMNVVVILLAKLILPGYIQHVITRSGAMLSVHMLPVVIVPLAVFAVGEEIAWRAFFQNNLKLFFPEIPALFISSALFSLGHLTSGSGSMVVVAYDLLFVFVNALFYGIIFELTDNAWMSAFSHFLANLFAVIMLFFL